MVGGFVRLCAMDEIAAGTSRRFDVGPHRIALVRIGNDFYAIGDRCSHANVSLAEGEVVPDECEIECHKHGSRFDLRTGKALSMPATKPVATYEVRIEGEDVLVSLD
ncbi:MAG TPA: non-heme iron oxygenase ferredoxin subunit [Acidimicrobiales bacterium]|nr:non-heme iron oxygenase ferredoxin subunit [Acidimicrobiales bacterium]